MIKVSIEFSLETKRWKARAEWTDWRWTDWGDTAGEAVRNCMKAIRLCESVGNAPRNPDEVEGAFKRLLRRLYPTIAVETTVGGID